MKIKGCYHAATNTIIVELTSGVIIGTCDMPGFTPMSIK